jgi:hypothetical protein
MMTINRRDSRVPAEYLLKLSVKVDKLFRHNTRTCMFSALLVFRLNTDFETPDKGSTKDRSSEVRRSSRPATVAAIVYENCL